MSEETRKSPVVVSVINLKGGVGKTTVAALFARYAARMNLNVLAVDLDPQANLSQALMTERDYQQFMESREASIVELFNGYLPPSPERSAPAPLENVLKKVGSRRKENFHLIPSRFDFADNLISRVSVDEHVLAKFISDEMGDKDLILIDCAPTESVLTRTAYHASRYVLVPVKTEFFSTIGFPLL
ncbi:MAG: AAA family ATPase [Nitrospinae bacterium]|nr:AAA family ATPase [Nitrospinota bacterium]